MGFVATLEESLDREAGCLMEGAILIAYPNFFGEDGKPITGYDKDITLDTTAADIGWYTGAWIAQVAGQPEHEAEASIMYSLTAVHDGQPICRALWTRNANFWSGLLTTVIIGADAKIITQHFMSLYYGKNASDDEWMRNDWVDAMMGAMRRTFGDTIEIVGSNDGQY